MRTAAVILAAGRSSRMGRNKLLIEVGGGTVLGQLIDALGMVVGLVVVVSGYDTVSVASEAEAHGAKVVYNMDYDLGMTTSFQTGLRAVRDFDAVFLVLGDQLRLSPDILRRMIRAMEANPAALIISPVYDGKRGHPLLIQSSLFQEFLGLRSKDILREVVLRHKTDHMVVDGDEWTTFDLDSPSDLERALNLLKE